MVASRRFSGRTGIILGASGTLGQAVSRRLSQEGASLFLLGRREQALDGLAQSLQADLGATVHRCVCDITDPDDVSAMTRRLAQACSAMDFAVNAIGEELTVPVALTKRSRVESLVEANLEAPWLMVTELRKLLLLADPPGSIVHISSVAGLQGTPGAAWYAATKAAVLHMTRSTAREWAKDGIRLNAIAAGCIKSPMLDRIRHRIGESAFAKIMAAHPLGLGEPEDIAAATAFLLSADAKWITGTVLTVDGGYTA